MKRLLLICPVLAMAFLNVSCEKGNGELVGVQDREMWFMADPYGTVYIPMGSYNMGPSDQEVPYALHAVSKTVSVQAFYMDDTELSTNEYRQFVYHVRDSIGRRVLSEDDDEFLVAEEEYLFEDQVPEPLLDLDWTTRFRWDDPEVGNNEGIVSMYLPKKERFYNRRELDTRRLNYHYYWINLKKAADKRHRFKYTQIEDVQQAADWEYNPKEGINDREDFIVEDVINVYPDTLAWVHDFTYSFNEPMTNMYFWHPAYDDYPVVGVDWKQARAFCIWRSRLLNSWRHGRGLTIVNDYRLPTESEWEYAARGGLDLSPYPWGGPYIRNSLGCFLGNFKPMRGDYIGDGGFHTVKVTSYWPNEYGLWNMGGNVSEWTSNAFDEAAFEFNHDLNADFLYEAEDSDPEVLKRKVIRGGSWKDVGYYLQVSSRSYEYQDTAKSYIGFRCVMTFLGRAKEDF